MTATNESGQRILIVEDSELNRRVIELSLRRLNWLIDVRKDGVTGLEAVRDSAPDVLILDIGLPGIDGWEVMRRLRQEDHSQVSILVLTAHTDNECRVKAELAGADAFLTKPFRPADLRNAVESLAAA